MALGIFAVAFEKKSLPPYTRVRWRGMVRCGAFATEARKSMVVETSFANSSHGPAQPRMTKLVSTSRRPVSGGMGARKHFSTLGCSTRSLPRTVPSQCRRCIGVTSVKSGLAMKSGCVREVERAAFTPLVFSAAGGASKLTTTFLKRLASLLAERLNEPYCVAMAWLRARLSFSLLRSAIACLRSSRRKFHIDSEELHPALAVGQARLPT